jgi:hypothetical protein
MKDEMYVAFPSTITYIFGINTCTLALFPTVYYMSNICVTGSCDYVSRTISEYYLMNSAFFKICTLAGKYKDSTIMVTCILLTKK